MTPAGRHPPSRQHGGASLAVTLMVAVALSLLAAMAHHALLAEQRMAANQHRATVAFDAAEAGIDWVLARLNDGSPHPASCTAGEAASRDGAFRDRHAGLPDMQGRWQPPGLLGTCTLQAGTWQCTCDGSSAGSHTSGPPAASSSPAPRFSVSLQAGDPPHTLRVVATGCAVGAPNAPCAAQSTPDASAAARITVDIGHLPALAHAPVAALTVRGALSPSARWTLVNRDPASGITLHTGAAATTQHLTLQTVPGTPAPASVIDADVPLRDTAPARFFASLFRLDKPNWVALPTVRRIPCTSACDSAVRQAVADGARQLWLDGGLSLADAATIGSPSRPVLLVADGPVRLSARATVHGLVYTTSAEWHDGSGAAIHGAVVAEGALNGPGGSTVHHDAAVLAALHRATGTFARIPGSWRDF